MTLPEETYLIAPAAVVDQYARKFFKRTAQSEGMTIGVPVYEREGVPDRRAAIVHRFTSAQMAFIGKVSSANNHDAVIEFVNALPSDWRFAPIV